MPERILMIALAMAMAAAAAHAEMAITTRDGKRYTVPVSAGDVKEITFKPSARSEAPAPSISGEFLGCYKDGTPQDVDGMWFAPADLPSMTVEKCVEACAGKGFAYAATQYAAHCYCGNTYGRYGAADNCDMKCDGDPKEICGGAGANSVYRIKGVR